MTVTVTACRKNAKKPPQSTNEQNLIEESIISHFFPFVFALSPPYRVLQYNSNTQ